jgi:hypothetical protein
MSDEEWSRGYEMENERNADVLSPLNARGHWRKFQTHVDTFDGIIARTVRFTGVKDGYATFAPDDLYIWDENGVLPVEQERDDPRVDTKPVYSVSDGGQLSGFIPLYKEPDDG